MMIMINPSCFSSGAIHLIFKNKIPLSWSLLKRLERLARASEPQESSSLQLSITGIISFLYEFGGWNLGSCACEANTLPTKLFPQSDALAILNL